MNTEIKSKPNQEQLESDLWEQIAIQVEKFFRTHFLKTLNYFPLKTQEKKIKEAISREKAFVEGTIRSVVRLQEENPSVEKIVLFDLDDTLGTSIFDPETDETIGFLLRPSTEKLLNYLKRHFPEIKIGLLTSKRKVQEQLEDENFLKAIQPFIDRDKIYSVALPSEQLYEEEEIQAYLRKHPAVDLQKAKQFSWQTHHWPRDNYPKMETLRKLYEEKKGNIAILAIDDITYPLFLQYGFSLTPHARFPSYYFF